MQLHEYQKVARDFCLDRLMSSTGAGLWLDPGLGKTAVSLHIVNNLQFVVNKVLVVAPLRVITSSWPSDIAKWNLGLSYVIVHGTPKQRLKALETPADIYLINYEGLHWLANTKYRFDFIVFDEITKVKNWSAQCTKAAKHLIPSSKFVLGLTGTPVSNGLVDIFSQHYMLDRGKVLGTAITKFREQWCRPCGFEGRKYEVVPQLEDTLLSAISDWYIRQEALDHLDMPEVINNTVLVDLPDEALATYKQVEKEMVCELEEGTLAALSPGSKYNLCRQIAAGGAYDMDKNVIGIHDAKIDALEDIVDELNGKPVLVGYNFRHEAARIKKRWPKAEFINGDTKASQMAKTISDWQAGRIRILAAQCRAMSHGVDGLQYGGNHIVWLSPTDQPEIRNQFEARINRQGAKGSIGFYHILAKSTVEVGIKRGADAKEAKQADVLRAVKEGLCIS